MLSNISRINLDQVDDKTDLEIYTSDTLSWEEDEHLVRTLKMDVRRHVSKWIQEKRYTVRLVIAALIFLIVYFIGTLAVRDPLPMFDELLIAFVVSALYWRFAKSRDEEAGVAILKRNMLYDLIEKTDTRESVFLYEVEKKYCELLELEVMEIAEMISENRVERFCVNPEDEGEALSFRRMFFEYLGSNEKSLERVLSAIVEKGDRGKRLEKNIIHSYSSGSYNIYLLALALSLS